MKIVAFAGGVGGAKLADGLASVLQPEDLTIIVNTGDDFKHWGLNISPDVDTVCYTLGTLNNAETGWGRAGETWEVFNQVTNLGGPDWFHIGDKDLATHIERTRLLQNGQSLSQIVRNFCGRWHIHQNIIPMSDDPVATIVDTIEFGELPFQEYFVHFRCEPTVKGFRFDGIKNAQPAPGVLESIKEADGIVFCPSNPWVSIDPILQITGIAALLKEKVVLAVSPIIKGQTVKGPAAKIFKEFGIEPSSFAVASHYKGIISKFVLDHLDSDWAENIKVIGISPFVAQTIMNSKADRFQLAKDVLNFIRKD